MKAEVRSCRICKAFFLNKEPHMTQEFKTALIAFLNKEPHGKFTPGDYPYLMPMVKWVQNRFPEEELMSKPDNLFGMNNINWKKFQELTGLKRLDFFIGAESFQYRDDDGMLHRKNITVFRGYPCPTIQSALAGQGKYLTRAIIADLIESSYLDCNSFQDAEKLLKTA